MHTSIIESPEVKGEEKTYMINIRTTKKLNWGLLKLETSIRPINKSMVL